MFQNLFCSSLRKYDKKKCSASVFDMSMSTFNLPTLSQTHAEYVATEWRTEHFIIITHGYGGIIRVETTEKNITQTIYWKRQTALLDF